MAEPRGPSSSQNPPPSPPPPPSASELPSEIKNGNTKAGSSTTNSHSYSGQKFHYPNPPDPTNPDPATLREQWRFAIRQYSKWYSHAWGTAIFAGLSFFALGWIIKGSNPLPSFNKHDSSDSNESSSSSTDANEARP
uniref:Uncharacterized protein n=1 Tax=Rhizophora mucronata TaxID=61149 RepID=A0A2P2PI47_RHIMU